MWIGLSRSVGGFGRVEIKWCGERGYVPSGLVDVCLGGASIDVGFGGTASPRSGYGEM